MPIYIIHRLTNTESFTLGRYMMQTAPPSSLLLWLSQFFYEQTADGSVWWMSRFCSFSLARLSSLVTRLHGIHVWSWQLSLTPLTTCSVRDSNIWTHYGRLQLNAKAQCWFVLVRFGLNSLRLCEHPLQGSSEDKTHVYIQISKLCQNCPHSNLHLDCRFPTLVLMFSLFYTFGAFLNFAHIFHPRKYSLLTA